MSEQIKKEDAARLMYSRYGEWVGTRAGLQFLEEKLGKVHALTCEYRTTIVTMAQQNFKVAQKIYNEAPNI
jgi:hypothetical protein